MINRREDHIYFKPKGWGWKDIHFSSSGYSIAQLREESYLPIHILLASKVITLYHFFYIHRV